VSLLTRDPDAPTPSEVEYAHKMIEHQMDIHSGKKQHAGKGRLQQAFMVPQTQLEKQNIVLKKRVCPRHIAFLVAQRVSHSRKMHGTHCQCARCQSKFSVGWALNSGAALQVIGLEHEVRELSADLTAKGHHHLVKHALRRAQSSVGRAAVQAPLHTQTLHGQAKRMQWAQEVLAREISCLLYVPCVSICAKAPFPALRVSTASCKRCLF
jgi:hypothetical protein